MFGTCRYLTGQVDKRTLEKYEREAKEKNRETWLVCWNCSNDSNVNTVRFQSGFLKGPK